MTSFETIEWTSEGVRMLDQRVLPGREEYLTFRTSDEVVGAIRDMVIRGAPAIGVAAAMGLALAARHAAAGPADRFHESFDAAADRMATARPTAVNLTWAVERVRRKAAETLGAGGVAADAARAVEAEARAMKDEDVALNRALGGHGAALVPGEATILTHCNAGALATAGYGTALGVVRAAREAGKTVRVLADETRPFLQGARLTAWELTRDGIDTTVIPDGAAGHFLAKGSVDLVIVGADRIAANGDVANKIGTYTVAVLASRHRVPFYVAAPLSTVDLACSDGSAIPIEERPPREVTHVFDRQVTAEGASVANPAFDVTPHDLVSAIVTERGVARPPYGKSLRALKQGGA
jgi:methylthioribose-1-phosphate isomerase